MLRHEFKRRANFGPAMLDRPLPYPQKTVAVLGIMGGGTSMVAAVLDALGVYMGPEEDLRQGGCWENFAMRSVDPEVRLPEVERCNRDYAVWGWKAVPGFATFKELPENIRNPHALFVYRDAMAVAQRWTMLASDLAQKPLDEFIEDVLGQYRQLSQLLVRIPYLLRIERVPRLVVSYQHSIQHPELLVAGLCDFLGLKPTTVQRNEAIKRVSFEGGYCYTAPEDQA